MPLSIPLFSRKNLKTGSLGSHLGLLAEHVCVGDDAAVNADRFVLLSDLHIDANPDMVERGTNTTNNFIAVRDQLLALSPQPAALLCCGDFAHHHGTEKDYAAVIELLKPLRAAGLPIFGALGNHDHRERFRTALLGGHPSQRPVEDRHVVVIESPKLDWYILDSLEVTNDIPGSLGPQQLQWLAESLDARSQRPAIVMVHHQPDLRPEVRGLRETRELMSLLAPRRQVKALIYGHTHNWNTTQNEHGLHQINLPPTAYVFAEGKPQGWVDVHLRDNGATFELRCIDPCHPNHNQTLDLTWR